MNDLIRETKVLFLAIRAINSQAWSPVLYEALDQLCKSSNKAISDQSHTLLVGLCLDEHYA